MNAPSKQASLPKPPAKASDLTPMMAQYIEIKTANPDSLLFYRMGDFYELFFEDAEEASRALGITLTKRGKHQGADIPMCGVPVHAADDYLEKLIALGFRVCVCEQMEDPAEAKKRGYKAVVRRDVVRLVTPGTLTEEKLLDAGSNNYLAALAHTKGTEDYAFAWVDLSTSEFRLTTSSHASLETDLARIAPKELILSDNLHSEPVVRTFFDEMPGMVVTQPAAFFDSTTADDRIKRFFNIASLDAFGTFSRAERAAAAAVLSYLEKTQIGEKPALNAPSRDDSSAIMQIDPATRANLEIMKTLSGEKKGSLLSIINMTVTGSGARLLAERLSSPSLKVDVINQRLDGVTWFLSERDRRARIREALKSVPDMARCLSRLTLSRGGPRDMAAIGAGLQAAITLKELLTENDSNSAPPLIRDAKVTLENAPRDLTRLLQTALRDDLPLLKRDGGFIEEGYIAELDETRALRDESRKVVANLQAKYSEFTEIKALKIKHNNVLGYFIEVTAQHAQRMMSEPLNETFIHRQTLANAVRFTTAELSDLQTNIVNAADKALRLELSAFDELEDAIVEQTDAIKSVARALSELDVASANAELAEQRNYCRPRVDDSLTFIIKNGRHPVVERALSVAMSDPFVANDCNLSGTSEGKGGQVWLITGPNMAGKSTFLRQNALIALLAQSGFYVPAEEAQIGVVDRLFSRVGAADDLARGRSTFMVEMVETAAILNQASAKSLVILDEIGRGTATFDGLSIAWAAIEHLHEINKSRALFATHYHELTALSETLDRLSNATVKVSEWKGDVVFLHEIVAGAADRSYGIQVAKLAGLPEAVIKRAKDVLSQLEASDRQSPQALIDDLPLFSLAATNPNTKTSSSESLVEKTLSSINPDDLTPREALEALYALKEKAQQGSEE